MAGLGAAMFTGEVGRGDSVAVFGCGGVGTRRSPGPGSRARPRSSASTSTPASSSWAQQFGATARRRTRAKTDPVEAIRELTDGNGADVCIEAVGQPEVFEQAFYARDLAGTVVQVGVPDPARCASSCR